MRTFLVALFLLSLLNVGFANQESHEGDVRFLPKDAKLVDTVKKPELKGTDKKLADSVDALDLCVTRKDSRPDEVASK